LGKSRGKKILSVVGFAFGMANPAMFGVGATAWSTGALMAGLYGASLGGTLWSVMHPPKTEQDYSRFDTVMNTISTEATITVIYGIRKWGGNQSWHKTEDDNKRVIKDIIICEGEIDSIYDLRANDVKIGGLDSRATLENNVVRHIIKDYSMAQDYLDAIMDEQSDNHVNNCSYVFHNGAPNQDPPSNWETVGGYKNCAWLRATLNLSEKLQGGNPNITMLVKGKKVWVYRKNSSTGKYEWFYEWSDNPIWCTRDFMISGRYGLGRFIDGDMFDLDELVEAAEYCDQKVTRTITTLLSSVSQIDRHIAEAQEALAENPNDSDLINKIIAMQNARQQYINGQIDSAQVVVTEKRFTLNMIIDQQRSATDILGEILSNFGGYLVWNNDKLSIRIEKSTIPSYSFSDDQIVKDSMEITQTPLSETPNRYRVGYFDPLNNWTQVKILMEDTGDQQERNRIISKDVTLSGVVSQGQALRLSRFFKDLNRVCSLVVSFSTATYAMHLECGDVINITWNGIFENKPFRILEIADNGYGLYKIKAREYNDSIYNDDLGAEISSPNYLTVPSPLTDRVPDVTNLSLSEVYYVQKTGALVSYVQGTCDLPGYTYFRHAVVEYSDDEMQNWHYLGTVIDGSFIIPNVQIGKKYYARVKVENTIGRRSSGVISAGCLVEGKNQPPSNVDASKFQYQPVSGGFLLTWEAVSDPDLDGYDIYQGENGSSMASSVRIANKLYSTSLFVPITKAGVYSFHIVAVDTSGNVSQLPATILAQFNAPPNVEGFDVVINGDDLDFRWQPISQSGIRYEIRRGEAWGYGELIGKTANAFYRILFPASGNHDFWIKAIDAYGNYSESATHATITTQSSINRNMIKGVDEVVNGWNGTKINFDVVDNGLKMVNMAIRGEYIADIDLLKTYLARNWIDTSVTGISGQEIAWDMATFTWGSAEANSPWKSTADIDGTTIKHQIAYWKGVNADVVESFSMNDSLTGTKGIAPSQSLGVTYEDGRFKNGVRVKDTTKISYSVAIPSTFSTMFNLKIGDLKDSAVYLTLVGSGGKLWVGYDTKTKRFYLKDSNNKFLEVECTTASQGDYVTIGICQTLTQRRFFVKSYSSNVAVSAEGDYAPLGNFTAIYLYPYQLV